MFEYTSSVYAICRQIPSYHGIFSKTVGIRKGALLGKCSSMPATILPSRNTMILRRKNPVAIYKQAHKPKLERKHQLYELVENTNCSKPQPLMDVVLKSYVPGLGNDGDIVTLKKYEAYNRVLVTGLGDFATPENLEYSKLKKGDIEAQEKLVTISEEFIIKFLRNRLILVMMNKDVEWKLEPWHVCASLRLNSIQVMSPSQIQLPDQPITGPNMDLQDKAFYATVTLNKKHKIKVRCRIHHWATSPLDRLPLDPEYWTNRGELLFPEDKQYEVSETK